MFTLMLDSCNVQSVIPYLLEYTQASWILYSCMGICDMNRITDP